MLNFFINDAWAQASPQQGGGTSFIIMMVVFIAIFYFILIRPQAKQAKEHKAMLESLSKGDEIVTSGGIMGRINKIGDNFIAVEIAKDLEIKVQKHAVSAVLPKGTMKSL
jgi:preprotein translocase subunit YajC